MVLPNRGASLSAKDIAVTVGDRKYAVDSMRKPDSIKKVVVFDLHTVAPRDLLCFLSQMKDAVDRLSAKDVDFFVIPREESDSRFEYGDRAYQIFPAQPSGLPLACSSGPSSKVNEADTARLKRDEGRTFGQFIKAFWPPREPVQLVWVTQDFFGHGPGGPVIVSSESGSTETYQNAPSVWLNYSTAMGLMLFPVIWQRDEHQPGVPVTDPSYLGGEGLDCRSELGPCIDQAIQRGSTAVMLKISGPPVAGSSKSSPPEMKVTLNADPANPFPVRPFEMPADPSSAFPVEANIGNATIPLFTNPLEAKVGCHADKGGRGPIHPISLMVPTGVIQDGGPALNLYVSVQGTHESGLRLRPEAGPKVRELLQVTDDTKGGGNIEVCVSLPTYRYLPAVFGIILFNSQIHWAGSVKIAQNRAASPPPAVPP